MRAPDQQISETDPDARSMATSGRGSGRVGYDVKAAEERLDRNPQKMRLRRQTVEHPFGTLKTRMGYTHVLTTTLPKAKTAT